MPEMCPKILFNQSETVDTLQQLTPIFIMSNTAITPGTCKTKIYSVCQTFIKTELLVWCKKGGITCTCMPHYQGMHQEKFNNYLYETNHVISLQTVAI